MTENEHRANKNVNYVGVPISRWKISEAWDKDGSLKDMISRPAFQFVIYMYIVHVFDIWLKHKGSIVFEKPNSSIYSNHSKKMALLF